MKIKEDTVVEPLPCEELLAVREQQWELSLPQDYREFIMEYNGGEPDKGTFLCQGHRYVVTRFLCILENIQESKDGWYDIGAVESQIGERLTDNEDLIGIEVLPIAELFQGDFACLDFREDSGCPSVCVWSHEESGDFEPVTYQAAASFTEFLEMLS